MSRGVARRRRASGRDGFILVSVLLALIVLGGLVAAVAYLTRTAVVGAASAREALVIDSLVQSGVELAAYELFTLKRPAALVNGQRIRLNDGVVTLFAMSEAGKVDLNTSPPELLAGLWNAIGAPGMPPETFAARIVDFRDVNDEVSKNGGAEMAQYTAAGPDKAPANGPFERIDQLQDVLDVTPAQALQLAPLVTVHNPDGKVAILEASLATLRAIPGGAKLIDQIPALKASRREGQDENQADALARQLGDAAKFVTLDSEPKAFSVRVEVERNGARRAIELILTASKTPVALYFVTDRIERPTR